MATFPLHQKVAEEVQFHYCQQNEGAHQLLVSHWQMELVEVVQVDQAWKSYPSERDQEVGVVEVLKTTQNVEGVEVEVGQPLLWSF